MPERSLRLIFAGTPEFAARHLQALLDSRHQIVAVYTQPDRPAGRGKRLQASPVKQLALEAGLPVEQPISLREASAQATLAGFEADVMVVVAYGLILPQVVLDTPAFGCLNVHASLLPRWRGAAPIQRAIEAGDRETGVTLMQMEAGLDTGPMLATAHCPIDADTTGGELHDRLADLGPPLLLQVLEQLQQYLTGAEPQDDQRATYAHKIDKAEAQLVWHQPAEVLARRVRAFNPFPVCFSVLESGERLRIWAAEALPEVKPGTEPGTLLGADRDGLRVACGQGVLKITRLQLPGGKPLAIDAVLNARANWLRAGARFLLPESADTTPSTAATAARGKN